MADKEGYTKGEWRVDSDFDWVLDDKEKIVANCTGHLDAKANTHLIAQAPRLYEALKGLLKWAELSYSDDTGEWADENDPAIVQSKQALAKVDGKG